MKQYYTYGLCDCPPVGFDVFVFSLQTGWTPSPQTKCGASETCWTAAPWTSCTTPARCTETRWDGHYSSPVPCSEHWLKFSLILSPLSCGAALCYYAGSSGTKSTEPALTKSWLNWFNPALNDGLLPDCERIHESPRPLSLNQIYSYAIDT